MLIFTLVNNSGVTLIETKNFEIYKFIDKDIDVIFCCWNVACK